MCGAPTFGDRVGCGNWRDCSFCRDTRSRDAVDVDASQGTEWRNQSRRRSCSKWQLVWSLRALFRLAQANTPGVVREPPSLVGHRREAAVQAALAVAGWGL